MASMRMGTKVGEDTTIAAALSTADHYVRVWWSSKMAALATSEETAVTPASPKLSDILQHGTILPDPNLDFWDREGFTASRGKALESWCGW